MTPSDYQGLADRFMYCPFMRTNAVLTSASSLSQNIIRAVPFVVYARILLNGAALIPVSGGGVGFTKFRFGIYKADPQTKLPAELLWQSPEITLSQYNKAYAISGITDVGLQGGVYYFAVMTNAISKANGQTSPLVFQGFSAYYMPQIMGFDTAAGFNPVVRLEANYTYAAVGLPANFPGAYTFQSGGSLNLELFLMKTETLQIA